MTGWNKARIVSGVLLAVVAVVYAARSEPEPILTVSSGPELVQLVESFTSEGCSSCPSADRWMSRLKEQDGLWSEFVPVAFHVDFWDYLGWLDSFASSAYSQRLRTYVRSWPAERSVVTPSILVQGKLWKRWRRNSTPPDEWNGQAGLLNARLYDLDRIEISYTPPERQQNKAYSVYGVLLGMNIVRDIAKGENRGRTLLHDFVVLGHGVASLSDGNREVQTADVTISRTSQERAPLYAMAVWVVEEGTLTPVQSAGGHVPSAAVADQN